MLTLPLVLAGVWLPDQSLLVVALLVSVILVPIFGVAVRAARLRVSDDGVELRQLGVRVATPWTNVVWVRMVRGEAAVAHAALL